MVYIGTTVPGEIFSVRRTNPARVPLRLILEVGRYIFNETENMLRSLIQSNAGLLLVVASEVFFAFMNVSVKVLTTGESEVPVFEVFIDRKSSTISYLHLQIILLRMVRFHEASA